MPGIIIGNMINKGIVDTIPATAVIDDDLTPVVDDDGTYIIDET